LLASKAFVKSHKVRGKREPFASESKQQQAFHAIKEVFVSAPALGLPDVKKPSFLCVHKRSGMASRVLTQYVCSWHRLMAYVSKQLDSLGKDSLANIRDKKKS
jgi:hypothetical protein